MIVIYVLLGLVALLLLMAALMAKTFNVEKTIVIKKPVDHVMRHVSDFAHYSTWNPWQQMEPSSSKTITGTPGTPGHRYEWQGKKIGTGHLTLRSIDTKHVHFDLEFVKPWKSKAKDNWLFEPWGDGGETKVTWQNSGELPWPMARLMGPMITKNLNHQFGVGLENLKKMCEVG
jgi:Polyketide cyclase / dehydrase and lipid transport